MFLNGVDYILLSLDNAWYHLLELNVNKRIFKVNAAERETFEKLASLRLISIMEELLVIQRFNLLLQYRAGFSFTQAVRWQQTTDI